MGKILMRIKDRTASAVGADRLNPEFLQFTRMHMVYLFATNITMTFVTTLLLRVASGPAADTITLKYNIIHFFFVGSSMVLAAIVMRWLSNKAIVIIGISFSMLTYLFTFLFMQRLDIIYPLVAAVHGIATGFYFITYFNSISLYSRDDTRDIAMSFIGILAAVVSITMPVLSGAVIEYMPGLSGYYTVFGICFAVAGIAVYLVVKLPNVKSGNKKTKFLGLLKRIYTKNIWFFVIHMDFFKGIREGAFGFFLNVLLFSIVKNEMLIGVNTFLVGTMSMFSCIAAGKLMRPSNRVRCMAISTSILTIIACLMFFELNIFTIMLLSVASAFLGVFMVNPVTAIMYTVLDAVPDGRQFENEVIATTECYKNVGRVLGVLLIMVLPKENIYYVLSLVILIASQFITTLFARITAGIAKRLKEQQNA